MSCFHADTIPSSFTIKFLSVNDLDGRITSDQREVVIPIPNAQLMLRPVWTSGSRDVALVFMPNEGADLRLDSYQIEARHLGEVRIDHPDPTLPPYYYLSRRGETQILKLPVHIDAVLRIGLMSDKIDADGDAYTFLVRIASASKTYDIRIGRAGVEIIEEHFF